MQCVYKVVAVKISSIVDNTYNNTPTKFPNYTQLFLFVLTILLPLISPFTTLFGV